jgi:C_GCAxxG_C_C family probable redox protein
LQGLQAYYDLGDDGLWQLMTGLGAGIGRRGFTCGAVTGAAVACGMVISRRLGSTRDDRGALREETYRRVQDLTRRFEAEFGTVECRKLTGCDLLTPEGQAEFVATNANDRVCRPAVRFALQAAILALT